MTYHQTRYHKMVPCVECGTMTREGTPRCPSCYRRAKQRVVWISVGCVLLIILHFFWFQ